MFLVIQEHQFRDSKRSNILLGAFVAAPVGGLLWAFGAFGIRIGAQWLLARSQSRRFEAFNRPPPYASSVSSQNYQEDNNEAVPNSVTQRALHSKGSFF